MLGQVNQAVLTSIDNSNNQLWVHPIVTIVKEGIAEEVRKYGVEGYVQRHGRSPPPEGWDALMIHYGKLHADGTAGKRECLHNALSIAHDYSLSKQTMADWKIRTGVLVKQFMEFNQLSTAIRAGKVPKFVLKIMESKEGLLNEQVWNGSAGIEHARVMMNDWFRIYYHSRLISYIYDFEMFSLVARTTFVTVLCSQEVITAFCSPTALYFSMNVHR